MNASLQDELKALYKKYPELQDCSVIFTGEGKVILQNKDSNSGERLCEQRDLPSMLKGPSSKIGIRESGVHGHGVFALEDIDEGELIEEAKLLRLSLRRKYIHDKIILDYAWANKKCGCNECKQHGTVNYMALGFGSVYNHADVPNTVQQFDYKKEVFTIIAAKQIKNGEEIFVSYGEKYWLVREFWNQVKSTGQLEKFFAEKKG